MENRSLRAFCGRMSKTSTWISSFAVLLSTPTVAVIWAFPRSTISTITDIQVLRSTIPFTTSNSSSAGILGESRCLEVKRDKNFLHTFDIGLVVKDKNVVFLSYRESFTTFSCEKYLEIRFFLLPLHRIIGRIMEFILVLLIFINSLNTKSHRRKSVKLTKISLI